MDFRFKIFDDEVHLERYNGTEENVVIPDTFEGKPVTVIGEGAFKNNSTMVTVSFPNKLNKIFSDSFIICTSLKEIVIPDTVTDIELNAFFNCHELEKIVLPKRLKKIPYRLFGSCNKLKKCIFPENLEVIDTQAFSYCYDLTELILPSTLKIIEQDAFLDCESITKINCTNEELKFHKKSFIKCNSLKEIPFFMWKQLELTETQYLNLVSNISTNWDKYDTKAKKDYISFIKRRKKFKKMLFTQSNSALVHFLIQEGVPLNLDEVTLYLDENIATGNTQVTSILLDYKTKNFEQEAINEYNTNQELVEIGLELPTLKQFKEKWTCRKADGGLQVTGYKWIKSEHEVIPKELADGRKIVAIKGTKDEAFSNIRKLTIEAPITEIPRFTFADSKDLTEIAIPDTINRIGEWAFQYCTNLKVINIPPKVKIISEGTFFGCESLELIKFPANLLEINDLAFYQCKSLKSVTLPESLVSIGVNGFYDCIELETVIMGENTPILGDFCFKNCQKLKSISIPKTATILGNGAFINCKQLADKDGFLIINNILFDYLGKETAIKVPENVNQISQNAFQNSICKEIILNENIDKLLQNTFARCNNLEKITIPKQIKHIPQYAFSECVNLKEVHVYKNTKINPHAFVACNQVETIFYN